MNENNRLMFLVLVAGGIFAVGFGIFIGVHRFYDGIVSRDEQLIKLKQEESNLIFKNTQLEKARKYVEKWRSIALPSNVSLTGASYSAFLMDVMQRHRLTVRALPTPGGLTTRTSSRAATGPLVSPLTFTTQVEGTFNQFTAFLEDFYRWNLPHVIREITVEPQGKGSEAKLDIHLKIEILTMSNAPERPFVVPMPDRTLAQMETLGAMLRFPSTGLALAVHQITQLHGRTKLARDFFPQREYAAMHKKNIFAGLTTTEKAAGAGPDHDILKTVQLISITANNITEEAQLRNRLTNKYVRLRADGGFNTFEIRDANEQVILKGKVLAIKPRDLVFETDGKAYLLHIGQFLTDALKKELTAEELKTHDVELTATDQP